MKLSTSERAAIHNRQEIQDDLSISCIKDEDDEDDDDNEDKLDYQTTDPERIKAFNMFVRLFVDENLDRMVPISRQPREKIQAIIDSCMRQFPELGERARKRIRTYLKSCRRSKRPRDSLATDSAGCGRSIPPHLTSAAAEQILNQACENENQNAKRIRLGLEPISQPHPSISVPDHSSEDRTVSRGSEVRGDTNSLNTFRPFHSLGLATVAPLNEQYTNNNGPTDLSMKSKSITTCNKTLPHKLSSMEVIAVQQLVTGYRESAAFLLRSAEELEHLLLAQHSLT